MVETIYDVAIIGGGINGAGIARDAAGRGLSVFLCEKDDLANGTSSASTKLIHGGLRYLEYYEFGLVRSALKERSVLLKNAPHIIWPMKFVLPHNSGLRPYWLIRAGLFLYDILGGRNSFRASKGVNMAVSPVGTPLKDDFKKGFSYQDCWVEDSRLVILNALAAAESNARIETRTECSALQAEIWEDEMLWRVSLKNKKDSYDIHARSVVNAAGPWAGKILEKTPAIRPRHNMRLVKGSHIVVPQLYRGLQSYLLQTDDQRIVFAIPYEKNYTLIGTTEVEVQSAENPENTPEETEYLCKVVNSYFRKSVQPQDVVWSYSGIRPLVDDGQDSASSVTRDYVIDMDVSLGAPFLTIYGGKLTTYRLLAEDAMNQVVQKLTKGGRAWTRAEPLPGGNLGSVSFDLFFKTFRREYHWLPDDLALRYARSYGSRSRRLLQGCYRTSDMGRHFGKGIYEAEIKYLVDQEWARTVEDILWRRSKLGLHVTEEIKEDMEKYMKKLLRQRAKEAA